MCATLVENGLGEMGSFWTAENDLNARRRVPMEENTSGKLWKMSSACEGLSPSQWGEMATC